MSKIKNTAEKPAYRSIFLILYLSIIAMLSFNHSAEESYASHIGGATSPLLEIDFDSGVPGERVTELGTNGGMLYSRDQSYAGGQGAELNVKEGKSGFGYWGGGKTWPLEDRFYKGDEIWYHVRVFFPTGFDYDAGPHLKFMRVSTRSDINSNEGFNDWYINPYGCQKVSCVGVEEPTHSTPFRHIKEVEGKWTDFGDWDTDGIEHGVWETYEMYIKFDNVSVNDGGEARTRMWKDGRLIADITDRRTLETPESYSNLFYLSSYWNTSSLTTEAFYPSSGVIPAFVEGEFVTGSISTSKLQVRKIYPHKVILRSSYFDPGFVSVPLDFQIGETITGLTSGVTMVIDTTTGEFPTQTQKMYIDDLVITNQDSPPTNIDAQGNLMISANATPPPPVQCSDTIDNDNDGNIDYPADTDCSSSSDTSEADTTPSPTPTPTDDGGTTPTPSPTPTPTPSPGGTTTTTSITQCNDNLDNDGDGYVDFGSDRDCASKSDTTEGISKTPTVDTPVTIDDGGVVVPTGQSFSTLSGPFAFGHRTAQVTLLQQILASDPSIYPEGEITGYYGKLTVKAVQTFQCKYLSLCSGTPSSNGYGLAGPSTRSKINTVFQQNTPTVTTTTNTLDQATRDSIQAQINALQATLLLLLEQLAVLLAEEVS